MISVLIIFLSTISLILLNFFCKKKLFLLDHKTLAHKSFVSNNVVPLTGGTLLILNLILFSSNKFFLIFCILIFILGILSDLHIIINPLKKFIIQFTLVFIYIYIFDLNIIVTKIFFIDYLLKIKIFSIIFTVFCLLILMNGTNFIDGVNTLASGYYIIIFSIILYLSSKSQLNLNFNDFYYLLLSLVVIYFFNVLSKNYLGDSGSFLLSFVTGCYLITFCNNNLYLLKSVSPIFILLLLWYPAFENFFSILRRLINKAHPSNPDNYHLHQLLFIFIKLNFKNKIKINNINSLTGNLINFYNLLIFVLASQIYYHTKYLSYLVIFNILVYLSCYYLFKKNINKNYFN
jgi:UDP-N-acetylmuramyl pentapeptide phosphotransferase/UDP-N-acetylglucosamine-1-phosphate transferase